MREFIHTLCVPGIETWKWPRISAGAMNLSALHLCSRVSCAWQLPQTPALAWVLMSAAGVKTTYNTVSAGLLLFPASLLLHPQVGHVLSWQSSSCSRSFHDVQQRTDVQENGGLWDEATCLCLRKGFHQYPGSMSLIHYENFWGGCIISCQD